MFGQRLVAIFLMSLILALIIRPSFKIISFYHNQAEIISTHCVNKEKPALNCKGHCYLTKQLKSSSSEDNNAMPEISIYVPLACEVQGKIKIGKPIYLKKRTKYFSRCQLVSSYLVKVFTPPKSVT